MLNFMLYQFKIPSISLNVLIKIILAMWAVALFVFAIGLALGFDPGFNLLKVSTLPLSVSFRF